MFHKEACYRIYVKDGTLRLPVQLDEEERKGLLHEMVGLWVESPSHVTIGSYSGQEYSIYEFNPLQVIASSFAPYGVAIRPANTPLEYFWRRARQEVGVSDLNLLKKFGDEFTGWMPHQYEALDVLLRETILGRKLVDCWINNEGLSENGAREKLEEITPLYEDGKVGLQRRLPMPYTAPPRWFYQWNYPGPSMLKLLL